MPTSAEHRAHTRLPRAPLALVVCQVRFPAVFRLNEREFVASFQEEIRTTYPSAGQQQEFQVLVGPQGVQQQPGARQWRFADRDGNWVVVLGEASLSLETRRYTTADEFIGRVEILLRALATQVQPGLLERVGLRYINEIRHPQVATASSWVGLISEYFLGPIADEQRVGHPIQSAVQQLVLDMPPQQISSRQGHFSEGTTVASPLPAPVPPGPFYLLDFDHYWSGQEEFVPERTLALVDQFHNANYRLFRSAITNDLYSFFEAER